MSVYRVLVTGSRNWGAEGSLRQALMDVAAGRPDGTDLVVVHGACPSGADAMADTWARDYGFPRERHPADWTAYGRAAGFRRNAEMVTLGADACLCFAMPCADSRCTRPRPHDSHGATHAADLAERAGVPVKRFTQREGEQSS